MKGSGLLALLLCLLAGCQKPDAPRIWRFAIEETRGSVQDRYAQKLKEIIETRSQGRIEVKVYPYGTLGTSDQITELLHNGSLQLAMASPGHMGKLIPEVQVLLLHFVLSDNEAVNRAVLSSPRVRAKFDSLYADKGFHLLSMFSEGWQVWTTDRPVHRPEDFRGMKFRVMTSPLLLAAYDAYGASATPLPYGDVYSALQLNMIDGQVNPVFAIWEMSFYEVSTHMIFANQAPFVTSTLCNAEFYDSLSATERGWLDDAIEELHPYIYDTQVQLNSERLAMIAEARPQMVVETLDSTEREAFRRASLPVRDLYLQTAGPAGGELLQILLDEVKQQGGWPPTIPMAGQPVTRRSD